MAEVQKRPGPLKKNEAADKKNLNVTTYLVLIIWDVDKLSKIDATQLSVFYFMLYISF